MDKSATIFVAGHRGLVGSAILRQLQRQGFANVLTRTRQELDLTDAAAVRAFFASERPEHVVLAAAKVGGIAANSAQPWDFIAENLAVELNVLRSALETGVDRLLFLGSSCIYPRLAPQPMREEHLLTGALEPTNRPYALAKIAGIELCWSANRQHGRRWLAVMPTNLYGPGDTYDPEAGHVIPALIRRFHEARLRGDPRVAVWGTGAPRREFLYSDDMAEACVFVLTLPEERYLPLLGDTDLRAERFAPPLVNIGAGSDITIRELAELVKRTVGYAGELVFDASRPDGTPRKLLDVSRLTRAGWTARTPLEQGLALAYADFLRSGASARGL